MRPRHASASATPPPSSGHYFHLVYNGQAVRIPACSDTLCDLDLLLAALSFGEEKMPCSVAPSNSVSASDSCQGNDSALSDSSWALLVSFCTLFGALVGAAAVVFANKWSFQRNANKQQQAQHGAEHTLSPLA